MTAPGVQILERVAVSSAAPPTDTSTLFVAATSPQGPSGARLVQSLDQGVTLYGVRDPVGGLYDALDTFFREGGTRAYVVRVTGAGAVAASRTLKDATTANTLTVTANGPGAWGNNLSVQVIAGVAAGTYALKIFQSGVLVEASPDLTTTNDAVQWASASSKYVTATALLTTQPAVAAAAALTTGADGSAVVDADFVSALDRFTDTLGPGQVAAPGRTSSTVGLALLAHAGANNRTALIDAPDTPTISTLTSAAAALAGSTARYGALFAPWVQVQGVAVGTTRLVPPSVVVAGLIARTDPRVGPGTPAAGDLGISATAIGLSQSYTLAADRDTLNTAGVDIFRSMLGTIRLYAYRTLANASSQRAYLQLSQTRLLMGIKAKLQAAAEAHTFHKIDGRGHELVSLQGDLQAVLLDYYNAEELYGDTPQDAFVVDVGPAVNTPDTLNNGELHAVCAIRISPYAELVIIEIAKTPITQAVGAAA